VTIQIIKLSVLKENAKLSKFHHRSWSGIWCGRSEKCWNQFIPIYLL